MNGERERESEKFKLYDDDDDDDYYYYSWNMIQ